VKALSIHQPWAWAILNLGKNVENRSWHPPHPMLGEPFLIHASKARAVGECTEAIWWMIDKGLLKYEGAWPGLDSVERGGIVGSAVLESVIQPGGLSSSRVYPSRRAARRPHEHADSPWYASGQYGLVLAAVAPTPFVPCKGALGFFDVSPDVVKAAGLAA
jgi:hypothetical protein